MDKKELILKAALRLFVQHGFHGTPTSRIAVAAGVSNGTLFHYYKTKDELVVALYNSIKDALNIHLLQHIGQPSTYKEKFRRLFVHSLEWAMEHSDEYFFIQQFHYSPHLAAVPAEDMARQSELHISMLLQAAAASIFKPLPVDMIASLYSSQVTGVYQYLLSHSLSTEQQNKIINEAFELVWPMLANATTV